MSDELYQRKKAWAELEREGEEVKHNIKSLMRKEPQSTEISNPLLSDVVRPKAQPAGAYRVPQDVMLEEKHGKQFSNFSAEAIAAREAKASSPETKLKHRVDSKIDNGIGFGLGRERSQDEFMSQPIEREPLASKSATGRESGMYGSN